MTIENISATYTDGKVTITGKKPSGASTVKIFLDGSTTELGSATDSGVTWTIGPKALTAGSYAAKVTDTNGREVKFTLTVPAPPGGQIVTTDATVVSPPGAGGG